ncbi:MAG: hypothetical protein U9Q77_13245 [Candidatus Marinimicrobia bacterium]|nr:hypothetical protein [Candidatus Neomarinimicrobiota bacterium]
MKRIILFLIVLISVGYGQSAYYRLGYGDVFPTVDAFESSVGEGAVAWQDSSRFTTRNPAALAGLKRVYFSSSLGSEFKLVSESITNNTRLERLAIALPVGDKIGISLGAQATADFETEYESILEDGTLNESSQGGIWDYHLGLGYGITPYFSLGVKFHLLQGAFRRESNMLATDINELYVLRGDISGKSLELGLLTHLGGKVSLGLTTDIPYQTPLFEGRDSLAGTDDYVELSEELKAWPATIKVGVVYHHSKTTKYVAGISQQIFSADGFDDSRIFVLPAGWQTVPVALVQLSTVHLAPDHGSRSWLKRTGWQAGVSVKNYYLASSTDKLISEIAIISGLNLRLRNGRSLFDISSELGTRRGDDSLPEELFARIKLGIQVNDIWFRKVKRR